MGIADCQARSKYYYELSVDSKQRVLIGIHQEDERIQHVLDRKPYIAIGVAILKKNKNGKPELVYMKDFTTERQVELDVELDVGEYVILPRTSGCTMKRNLPSKPQKISLID